MINNGNNGYDNPKEGDIAVFKRRKKSSQGEVKGGHVGFFLEDNGEYIRLLGGNQSSAVSIQNYPKDGVMGKIHYELLSIRRA